MSCSNCKFYYVTWDKVYPRGCKYFAVQSKRWPSEEVLEATGRPCEVFSPKHKVADDKSNSRKRGSRTLTKA